MRLRSTAAGLRKEVEARRRIEEELRRSEERLALAAEESCDGIWDWDLLSDRIFFSRRYKESLGFADDEFPGDLASWEFRLCPDDRPRVFDAIRKHLKTGRRYDAVFRLRTKSGDYRWLETRGSAVPSSRSARPPPSPTAPRIAAEVPPYFTPDTFAPVGRSTTRPTPHLRRTVVADCELGG